MRYILLLGFLLILQSSHAQIGNPAPDFTVADVHGNTHHLYDYLDSGKVVVLDFFYTTCGPCQYYSPQVNLAYEKYGCNNAGVIFMAIDYGDTDAMVLAYDEEYNIEFPSVSGVDGGGDGVVSDYGVFAFPTFYVIDSTKKIVDDIDPPTLQVFDFRFEQLGIAPADCGPTGVVDLDQKNKGLKPLGIQSLGIHPNPAGEGKITFDWPFSGKEGMLEIFDLDGQVIRRQFLAAGRVECSTEGLAPGLYVVRIIGHEKGEMAVGKVIVQ